MAHSFIAYIDEAGDDGLTGLYREPGRHGGASHWLTIGATIWRLSRDLDAVRWGKAIINQLPEQRRNKPLHFTELNHVQRIMAISELCDKPMRVVAVFANKPAIREGVYVKPNQLYHYLCRYLIERISWFCRDHRRFVPEGDGRVKIIFSRRKSMNYEQFQAYLRLLWQQDNPQINIHWPVIDINGVEAFNHGRRIGLQIADVATSGINAALEPDLYGHCELRFARMLKPIIYSRNRNFLSYGAKVVPSPNELQLSDEQQEFVELFS